MRDTPKQIHVEGRALGAPAWCKIARYTEANAQINAATSADTRATLRARLREHAAQDADAWARYRTDWETRVVEVRA